VGFLICFYANSQVSTIAEYFLLKTAVKKKRLFEITGLNNNHSHPSSPVALFTTITDTGRFLKTGVYSLVTP